MEEEEYDRSWSSWCRKLVYEVGIILVQDLVVTEYPKNVGVLRFAAARENTIYSLNTAAKNGADYVEFDVQLTKDKVSRLLSCGLAVLDVTEKSRAAKRLLGNRLQLILRLARSLRYAGSVEASSCAYEIKKVQKILIICLHFQKQIALEILLF